MSFREKVCFIAQCDDCKGDYEHDYTPHWPSADDATDDAVGSGEWWTDGNSLLCESCKRKPHAFTADEYDPVGCGRCGVNRAEHDRSPKQVAS